ncbi:MAG TPA: CDP-alcohol phosphatidyltransferase family protein [Arthrobacter sp.]
MESKTAERASVDATLAVAAYGVAGIWLSTVHSPGLGLQSVGFAAGAAVRGGAATSVLRRTPRFSTPADRVTLLRAVLVSLCAVLAAPVLFTGRLQDPSVVVVGAAAFLLYAVDGPVARRTGTASAAGARLDAATDAALVLVLSCATAAAIGPWTLGIGALYYVFVAAGHFRPHLRSPLPSSAARKAIGAFQPFALLLALTPGIPPAAAAAAPALALPLLMFSFARDVVELERRRYESGPTAASRR